MTHGATMGGHVLKASIERAKIDAGEIEDVIMGCSTPEGATGGNIARQIALRAGCPVTTAGMTINRFCASGLQSIATAAQLSSQVKAKYMPLAAWSRSRAYRMK